MWSQNIYGPPEKDTKKDSCNCRFATYIKALKLKLDKKRQLQKLLKIKLEKRFGPMNQWERLKRLNDEIRRLQSLLKKKVGSSVKGTQVKNNLSPGKNVVFDTHLSAFHRLGTFWHNRLLSAHSQKELLYFKNGNGVNEVGSIYVTQVYFSLKEVKAFLLAYGQPFSLSFFS